MTVALITGAGGQLGRTLLATVPQGIQAQGVDRTALDITDADAIAATLDAVSPALLINAAAYTAVDKAESEREAAFACNAVAPGLLAAACAERGIPFVHVSTDFVFDGTRSSPYPVDAPVAPLGAYGQSKLEGEQAVASAHPAALTVRTSWVYAAEGKNFLLTMLRVMKERGAVSVVADQVGTPTHTISLAKALWKMAATDASGIAHYADAGTAAWYDFAVAIAEEGIAAGLLPATVEVKPIATADYPTPAARPAYSVFDRSTGWALAGQARHWRAELRDAIAAVAAST
ncbi:dTDP-4-dehydrorhamnose reductase [Sphingomonas sp. ID0503]|uniref:dTDP-4-dehydrorhamnose reductase n=1 Tax=Sphingomonas sp. ID0503 TaxID=3399691 RepID=UPI003AFA6DAB